MLDAPQGLREDTSPLRQCPCDFNLTARALCGDQKVHWICPQVTGERGPGISLSYRQCWALSQPFMYLVPYLLAFQKAEQDSQVTNSHTRV